MPLSFANIGEVNTIKKIGGLSDQRRRLEDLGFTIGSEVKLISKQAGNVIVSIKNSRVAISKEAAMKIMI